MGLEEDRRHPLRAFDASLIADYLRGRGIESVKLMPLGKSNTNYRLVLSDGEVCLLRLHHAEARVERENGLLQLVQGVVPVPEVLAIGEGWTMQSFVEGKPLAEAPEGLVAAARVLARMGSMRFPDWGWIEPDGAVTPFSFSNEAGESESVAEQPGTTLAPEAGPMEGTGEGELDSVGRSATSGEMRSQVQLGNEGEESYVAAMLKHEEVRAWIDPATAEALRRIEESQPEYEGGPRLVHGDFNPTNVLIHEGEVSAVLDWEFAHAGSPYMDIGNLLRHTDPAWVLEIETGLRVGGMELPEDWQRRAEMADLSSHLEFLTTQRSDAFKQRCVEWLRDFAGRYDR